MKSRWLIRSFCIGLVVFCVVAWVESYLQPFVVVHNGTETVWDKVELAVGKIGFIHYQIEGLYSIGWHIHAVPGEWGGWKGISTFDFLEFSFRYNSDMSFVIVTLWFPTVLSTLLLWFIWKKTRPKMAGRAFPIEPAAKTGESKS